LASADLHMVAIEVRATMTGELGTVHDCYVVEEGVNGAGVYCEKGINYVF
jgi:hypothetical protein